MENLRARLDRLDRVLNLRENFGGATVGVLCEYGFLGGDEPDHRKDAPEGVQRLALAIGLRSAVVMIRQSLDREEPQWEAEAVEARDILGVAPDATVEEVIAAAEALADRLGFSAGELVEVREGIRAYPRQY